MHACDGLCSARLINFGRDQEKKYVLARSWAHFLEDVADELNSGNFVITGDEGYKRAEVTGGGVALGEIDPRTMESRLRPGLFLCGEILDAFGPIGGHNFSWAWATGRAAGIGASLRASGIIAAPRAGKEPR